MIQEEIEKYAEEWASKSNCSHPKYAFIAGADFVSRQTVKAIIDLKFVSYDGKFPNLCSGNLKFIAVYSDGTEQEYNWQHCLNSGGSCHYHKGDWDTEEGDWEVHLPFDTDDPMKEYSEFTPMVMAYLTKIVNDEVEKGCCGGCS